MHARGEAETDVPVVLTIAAFDPSSGAGIIADLKTFAAHNCYGVAAVTALTVREPGRVRGRQEVPAPHDVPASWLDQQIALLAEGMPLAGVKIGLLGSAANVEAVVAALDRYPLPFVLLDPVFRSGSGAALLAPEAVELLHDRLLPKATLITPNPEEAAHLTGRSLRTVEEMKAVAAALHGMCGAGVAISGGHLEKPQDVFFDGRQHFVFAGNRVGDRAGNRLRAPKVHGARCTFSSAIAANLALGKSLPDAIVVAKAYVTKAMEKGYTLGLWPGLPNHLYRLQAPGPPRSVAPEPVESHAAGHR